MEKCFRGAVDFSGKITDVISEISCNASSPLIEFNLWWASAIILVLVFLWFLAGYPIWAVWAGKKKGEAELSEANFAEQVAIAKARARLSAAEMNKQAEVVEAEAVAVSINTIGDALQKNDSYLRWQWIKMMDQNSNSTIYVPTEAGLPILEAGKRP